METNDKSSEWIKLCWDGELVDRKEADFVGLYEEEGEEDDGDDFDGDEDVSIVVDVGILRG